MKMVVQQFSGSAVLFSHEPGQRRHLRGQGYVNVVARARKPFDPELIRANHV
jgi:hypothetical protein